MMFIVMGIVTSLIGVATIWILPDTPMQAKFLSDTEKTALLNHVSVNKTGIENSHFKFSHLVEIALDVQVWLMVLITVLVSSNFSDLLTSTNKNPRSQSPVASLPPTRQLSSQDLDSLALSPPS